MYQALYRKWRPQTFDQVVGQGHITETLKNQVKSDRLSHAYIFIGTRGTGKTTCARILAKAINCENPVDGNPCCKCPACMGIAEGSFMDIVELDAASNNGVDNVRALREEAVFSPVNLKKRVYIIDEVHMLSTAAFNALLKILEEPPKHLMFILATTELHKVPATVLSRCQRHSFRRIDSSAIAGYISQVAQAEGFSLEAEAAELIARLAEGGVRDALSLLDQCSGRGDIDVETVYSSMGLAGKRRVAEMLENILKHDSEKALSDFAGLWMDGKDPAGFLEELSALLRDVLLMKSAPRAYSNLISGSYDAKTIKNFALSMTTEEITCAMNKLQRSLAGMRDVKNTRTAAELCLISLCHNVGGESIEELKARVSKLEEALENGAFEMPVRMVEPDEEPYYSMEIMNPSATVREYDKYYFDDDDDELDDIFAEEQPEDAFLQRSRSAASENTEEAEPDEEPEEEEPKVDIWPAMKQRLSKTLPMPLPLQLGDDMVRGSVEGDVFRLEVTDGFWLERFKKPDVVEIVKQAALFAAGKELRVQVGPRREDSTSNKLEDLKKFKEVRFI